MKIGRIVLDQKKVVVENPVYFSCKSSIECCSNLRIPLTSTDVERIENHGYEIDQIVESLSPILIPSKTLTGRTEKVYLIKQRPFVRGCTFLKDQKCSIHEFKPFACRTFPFSLKVIDDYTIDVLIHESLICRSIKPGTTRDTEDILYEIADLLQQELQYRGIT